MFGVFVCTHTSQCTHTFLTDNFSSFRLNYYLFGLKPIWFHFTNILMHTIVCILFTRVCHIVAGLRDNFAFAAGLLFAVHPIHTEAVSI